MRRALAAATAAIAIAVATSTAMTVIAAGPASAKNSKLVKSAHVAFESCPIATTLMKATLLGTNFSANQPILVGISVRNESNHACGHAPRSSNPLSSLGIEIGPCGNVSLRVENAQRHNVFPGPGDVPSCTLQFSVRLRAHQSLSTVGVWNQQLGLNGQTRVPAGTYRIIIDNKITFSITLTSPSGPVVPGAPNTTPPSPGPCGSFFNLIASAPTPTPATTTTTTTTTPIPTGPKCPIGQVAPPTPGHTPTPTVPPSTTTTTAPGNSHNAANAANAVAPPPGTNPPSR
jgi:hypothetical protein